MAPLIIYFAQLSKNVGPESLMTLAFGAVPLIVFSATFLNKKSVWKLTSFDWACGALSVLGLIAWYISKDGTIAIVFTMIADFFASIPTVKKSYTHPETESYRVYFLNAIAAGISLFTIKQWNFANYGYILYVLLFCIVFVVLIKFKPQKR